MNTTAKITLTIDIAIQGDDRDQLWQVCCGSFPVLAMREYSDSDSDRWVVERCDDTNEEQYLSERETLRDCIYNQGYLIEGYEGDEWFVR